MILLDTTVLVYSRGGEHPLRKPAEALLRSVGAAEVQASTTVEVLQEFAHVRARRRDREDAARLTRDFATVLSPLTTVHADDLHAGLELFRQHAQLGAFDAVLAACAARTGQLLVTADAAIADVVGSGAIELADPALLEQARAANGR
jgi:uncharacterized protein